MLVHTRIDNLVKWLNVCARIQTSPFEILLREIALNKMSSLTNNLKWHNSTLHLGEKIKTITGWFGYYNLLVYQK